MAMIKCPECGHEISDRAPSCPSCGAKIENEIVRCPVCGDVYFKEQPECPHCHHRQANNPNVEQHPNVAVPPVPPAQQVGGNAVQDNVPPPPPQSNGGANAGTSQQFGGANVQNVQQQGYSAPGNDAQALPSNQQPNAYQGQTSQPTTPSGGYQGQSSQQPNAYQSQSTQQQPGGTQPQMGNGQQPPYGQVPPQTPQQPSTPAAPPRKINTTLIVLIAVIGVLVLGFGVYFVTHNSGGKEQQAYEYALNSNDPAVLESYLDNYRDADPMHRDKISQQLEQLKQGELDWTNTMVSGSKTALTEYLAKYPNSIHKAEAERKIDSLDWLVAKKANTAEAYNLYVTEHPNGVYIDEANNSLNVAKTKNIEPKEKEMLALVFRSMFRSINDRDDEALTSNFSDFLSSFLGKSNASKSDVIAFLNKIYKDDIISMEWRANNDMKITKREIGVDEYEYSVDFSAKQKIEREDEDKETEANYRIKAKVNPDGKITELNMVKVLK